MAMPIPTELPDILLEPVPASFARVADLLELLDAAEPRVRRAFIDAIGRARGLRSLEQIARLIEAGRIDDAVAAIDRTLPSFVTALQGAYTSAGVAVAVGASRALRTPIEFNALNDRAVSSLQRTQASLIRELGQEQRLATSTLLQGFADLGEDPRVQARVLRASIGLTERQAAAVANYRRLLLQGDAEALSRRLRDRRFDARTRAAVRGQRALTRAEVQVMVDRYRERYIAYRAKTIVRTETVRAVHEGAEEMVQQLVDQGLVRGDEVRREWRTARDEKVRASHRAMNGQRRAVGEPFISGHGNRLLYPGDPSAPPSDTANCRCVLAVALPKLRRRDVQ